MSPPIHTQSQSPLFALPAELRLLIFSYALTESLDLRRPYSPDTYYYRPGYTAPPTIHTALLRTCKRIHAEAHYFPTQQAEHTFFLCSKYRAPDFIWIPHLTSILEHNHSRYGPLGTPHIQVFAQLYRLENDDDLQRVLDIPHLDPRHVTLTIRHTDFWFWENWESLRLDEGWVNRTRFPNTVTAFDIQMETIVQRAGEIDYLAKEAATKWFFLRKDGRVLAADTKDMSVDTWTGSSVLHDARWVRDERRPGELDYHVVTVRWKLVPEDRVDALGFDLTAPRPKISVPDHVGLGEPAFEGPRSITVADMERLSITKEMPLDEVLQALRGARPSGQRARRNYRRRRVASEGVNY
ncbi:hypothetical protein P170DRAFT_435574 [Aspergillus steynii IBT 23096]|uniref:F-box domain-containing protein n=1 Tax=Aspergillus steynii IBT 23096 TaxID=1392250 RepID=A0A2I2GC13_9EURO|nr:uncharacterized protein P170DRAFT_435574 [Aspergillus steynii IBT 23096]PLB50377.1 hypothetical protein P170DRAFT_435574 [Aspergillus steynii IBT 23096]